MMQNLHKFRLFFLLLIISGTMLYGQQWQYRSPMPTARKGMAVTVLNDRIWVMGGRMTDNGGITTVEVYDPIADTWSTAEPNLNHARENATAQTVNGKIYVFGGTHHDQLVSAVEMYDPQTGIWQDVTNLPTPRFGLASVVVDSLIWLIGGSSRFHTNYGIVEIYDPQTNQWTTLPAQLNISRGVPMAAVASGEIYVFGGDFFGPVGSYEKYDFTTQAWTTEGDMLYNCSSAGYTVLNEEVWLVGGMGQGGLLGSVQKFQIDNGNPQWTSGPNLNTSRRELVTAHFGDKLYAIGGRGMMWNMVYNTVEELAVVTGIQDEDPSLPSSRVLVSNYPNPFNNTTIIKINLPERDEITLGFFDISGRRINAFYPGNLAAGDHTFRFTGVDFTGMQLASGVYFVRVEGKKFSEIRKINLIK